MSSIVQRLGDIEIDERRMAIHRDGKVFALRARPFALLQYLMANSGRVVSKDEAIDAVWDGRIVSDAALATTLHAIRKALGDSGGDDAIIRTHYGRGMEFASPDLPLSDEPEGPFLPPKHRASTVAVLAFKCLSNDPDLANLADGLTDDIATLAAKFRDVNVIPQSSSQPLLNKNLSIKEIGLQLGAHFVVEGSLRSVKSGLRISARLVDTASETHVWGDHFDFPIGDQSVDLDEVSRSIVASITPSANKYELASVADRDVEELTAFQCYLRGCALLYTFVPDAQAEAIELFDRAISLDPGFADAYAVKSYAMNVQLKPRGSDERVGVSGDRRTEQRLAAQKMAMKAIALDRHIPMAWVALARSKLELGEIGFAVSAVQRALELHPDLSWARFVLGLCYFPLHRCEDAVAEFDKALAASPKDNYRLSIMACKACAIIVLGRYDEAIVWSRKAQLEPDAEPFAYFCEICALGHLGQKDKAREAIRRARHSIEGFNIQMVERNLPLDDPSVRETFQIGLRRAGLT